MEKSNLQDTTSLPIDALTLLVSSLVKKLVDKPDLVEVQHIKTNGKSVIQVKVGAHDLSRVIGGEGRTFRALRSLVHTISSGSEDLIVDSSESTPRSSDSQPDHMLKE
jgi:predicted RNA-binding protein YlqC (UPF0109 family)